MGWKTSDFNVPRPVEQATAAPGEMRDVRRDAEGEYVEVWECLPPPERVKYRVIRCSWNADYTERTIYEIERVSGE